MANDKELKQLKEIKKELSEIKERTSSPRQAFISGVLYGAGWFVGGILAVALLGWLLNIIGVVPGLNELVEYVRSLTDELPRR